MNTFDMSKNRPPVKGASQSHDSEAPPNLINFMLKSWKPAAKSTLRPLKYAADYKRRREVLSKRFPGELLFIPTGHLKVRANDTFYPFRAGTDFFYLTGNMEPDCVLAMVPDKNSHRPVLFVEHNPGKTDATFFTDRVKGELWEGARLGVPESKIHFGIDDCRPLSELERFIATTVPGAPKGTRLRRGFSAPLAQYLNRASADQAQKDNELAEVLSEMRLIKDQGEITEITAAIRSTKRGFEDVVRRLKTAKSERELEGVFYTRARLEGNDVGYNSIVASGSHACTLHWRKNDGTLKKSDLLLLDAGVEGNWLYTADVTRTFPIGGKFSPAQREIYDLVLAAQRAALKGVKPGNDFMEPNRLAMKVLATGLEKLKILPTSAEEALREENQFYKRYSLHNVSHMLGLDVHDCAQARAENYKYGKLRAGMVLTVEPGLYFQADDLTVPAKYRGIGVRIEDDVVVTDKGCKVLSAILPTEASQIERWMKQILGSKKS